MTAGTDFHVDLDRAGVSQWLRRQSVARIKRQAILSRANRGKERGESVGLLISWHLLLYALREPQSPREIANPELCLDGHHESVIRKQLEPGRYDNASEIVRTGPRMLDDFGAEREKWFREENAGAFDRAPAGSNERCSAETVFSRLQARHRVKQPKARRGWSAGLSSIPETEAELEQLYDDISERASPMIVEFWLPARRQHRFRRRGRARADPGHLSTPDGTSHRKCSKTGPESRSGGRRAAGFLRDDRQQNAADNPG